MDKYFINGYFEGKQTNLLNAKELEELRDTKKSEFFLYLYNKSIGPNMPSNNINKIEQAEFDKLVNDFRLLNLENLIFLITLDDDITNLVLVYKEKYFNVDAKNHFTDNRKYSYDFLKRAIISEDYSLLNSKEELFFTKLNQLTKDKDPNLVSSLVIKHIYKFYLKKFNSLDKTLKNFFINKLTIVNIITLLRTKEKGFSVTFLKDNLINIDNYIYNEFISIFNLDIYNIIEELKGKYFIFQEPLDNYLKHKKLDKLFNDLNNKIYNNLLEESYTNNSLGQTIYYLESVKKQLRKIKEIYYEK